MKILVTGGLGFVGSVTARMLSDQGHSVTVMDNEYDPVGYARQALALPGVDLIKGDVREEDHLRTVFRECKPEAVCHFAGATRVAESRHDMPRYIDTNVRATAVLLEAMEDADCRSLLHASTSSVYGTTEGETDETAPKRPTSWYGRTKDWAEEIIFDHAVNRGLKGIVFRFGNVAGAGYGIYEDRRKDDRLIVRAVRAAVAGEPIEILGTDWPTPDGTCVRDYVHVLDIATAFSLALNDPPITLCGRGIDQRMIPINLGCARPLSVLDVVGVVGKVTGLQVPVVAKPRRVGDPASVWLSNGKAGVVLGWKPSRDIVSMVEDHWKARTEVAA